MVFLKLYRNNVLDSVEVVSIKNDTKVLLVNYRIRVKMSNLVVDINGIWLYKDKSFVVFINVERKNGSFVISLAIW